MKSGLENTYGMSPLFDFNTIVDTDVGLVRLISLEYLDPSIFDINYFEKPFFNILNDIYSRDFKNPLLLFAKNKEKDIDKLNQYYDEFICTKQKEILQLSITTGVLYVISYFNSVMEISNPVILYHSEEEKKILDDEPLLNQNNKVHISSMRSDIIKNSYNQLYFKYIEDAELFKDLKNKSFYFSKAGLNLNKEKDDLKESISLDQISIFNRVNIFDLYNQELIKK